MNNANSIDAMESMPFDPRAEMAAFESMSNSTPLEAPALLLNDDIEIGLEDMNPHAVCVQN